MAEIPPESKNENYPRYPYHVQRVGRYELVKQKEAGCNGGNLAEMIFQPVEIEQEKYASTEVHQLRGKLHLQLRVNAARDIR